MQPDPRFRWWALAALALSGLVIGLDLTILNVALPTLASDLGATTSDLQWFANAYNLVLAALMLPAGLLGDRFGRKKLLLAGLAVFGLGSLACVYATSPETLIGARALLGLGAAFVLPLAVSALPLLFDSVERAKAVSIWVTANAASFPLGPIIGGFLLDNFWWGSVFLINVPVVVLGLLAVSMLVPESRSAQKPSLDLPGILTSGVGLAGLTFGLTEAGSRGWSDGLVLATLVGGIVLLIVFVVWEKRRPGTALVDLTLFRSRPFTWGSAMATLVSFATFGLLFSIPQFFQAVSGADALGTGLRLLPVIGGLLVGAQIAEKLVVKIGAGLVVSIGFAFVVVGLLTGVPTTVSSDYWFVAFWIAVSGIGIGFVLPTSMDTALGTLTEERSGIGSAVIQAMRQVGGTVGVAVLGTVLSIVYRDRLDLDGVPSDIATRAEDSAAAGVIVAHRLASDELLMSVRTAFVHAMDVMLVVCAGFGILGVILAVVFLPRPRQAPEPEPGSIGEGGVKAAAQPKDGSAWRV
ncbi:MFS transporter [Micromonospora sp. NPDC023888]|uniref:MFS transporter n=1 Tax=Micromonospora sp. NPDC023888 TaxID=3155607 RepID=UPI0033EBE90C